MNGRWEDIRPAAIAGLGVLALLAGVAGVVGGPTRATLVIAFLAVGPGLALAPLLGRAAGVAELALALAVSIALDTVVAEAMAVAGVWSPKGALAGLAALSLAGAALQATGRLRPEAG